MEKLEIYKYWLINNKLIKCSQIEFLVHNSNGLTIHFESSKELFIAGKTEKLEEWFEYGSFHEII